MFAGKIESTLAKDTNTNHKNVNENSMEQNVIQINGGITINFDVNEKNITCKTQNFYILLVFLLITIALLSAVSI